MENRGGDLDAPYSYDESVEEAERYAPPPQQPAPRARVTQNREPKKPGRPGAVFPFKSAIAVGIVLILVGAAILWGKSAVTSIGGLFKSSTPVVEAPKDTGPLPKPKIPDRVGQPPSTDQVAPVAQRVVLYDEDPSDPKGKQYVGTVVWRTEPNQADRRRAEALISRFAPTSIFPTASSRCRCRSAATPTPRCRPATPRN